MAVTLAFMGYICCGPGRGQRCVSEIGLSGAEDSDFRGPMLVDGALTPPCPGFAVGKPAMVVVRVQGAPKQCIQYQWKRIMPVVA